MLLTQSKSIDQQMLTRIKQLKKDIQREQDNILAISKIVESNLK